MAGGHIFCANQISVGGSQLVDITRYDSELTAEFIRNRADGRRYAQRGCIVNHSAFINVETYNLRQALQASSSATLLGTLVNAPGVQLVIYDAPGGTVTHTISPAEWIKARTTGGHGIASMLDCGWEVVGQGGVEPTVTYAQAG
jgi:hypothetical protein